MDNQMQAYGIWPSVVTQRNWWIEAVVVSPFFFLTARSCSIYLLALVYLAAHYSTSLSPRRRQAGRPSARWSHFRRPLLSRTTVRKYLRQDSPSHHPARFHVASPTGRSEHDGTAPAPAPPRSHRHLTDFNLTLKKQIIAATFGTREHIKIFPPLHTMLANPARNARFDYLTTNF